MMLDIDTIRKIEEAYEKYWWSRREEREHREIERDAFKLLIFTILSQNTSSINTWRAYHELSKKFEIEPESLASAPLKEIEDAIKSGGLYRIKAERIKNIARIIMEKHGGKMEWIYGRDAREKLMELHGIGNKTADVIMASLKGQKNYFVIDTHMRRIAIRLGLAGRNASYEEIQEALKKFFPWDKIKGKENKIVSLFWLMAKHICSARNPKCNECVLKRMCRKNIK